MTDDRSRIVLTAGVVYAPRFPHSTAMIIDNGTIAWVGDDDGLTGQLLPSDEVIECGNRFIGPAFMDAMAADAAQLDDHFAASLWTDGERHQLATRGPEGKVISQDTQIDDSVQVWTQLHSELANGQPWAFGSRGRAGTPWDWIVAAIQERGITARAGFNAATRAGWRRANRSDRGELVPGLRAEICVWDCDEYAVQTPDDRLSRWSTDPRSGTPVLPRLDPAVPTPTLWRAYYGDDQVGGS